MRRLPFAILLTLSAAAPVGAQTPPAASDGSVHLGFGAGISSIAGVIGSTLLVPIDVIPHVRVEPEIGYSKTTSDQTTNFTPPPLPALPPGIVIPFTTSSRSAQATEVTSIGTGAFVVQRRDKLRLLFGGRAGYSRNVTDYSTTTTTTTSTFLSSSTSSKLSGYFAGPSLGGEYFVADRFSIGAELHLRYTSIKGDQQVTPVPLSPSLPGGIAQALPLVHTTQTAWQTRATVIVRVYLK